MTRWILNSEEEEERKEKRRSWQQHSKWRVWPIELFVCWCIVYSLYYCAGVIDNMQRRRWRINVDFPALLMLRLELLSIFSLVPLCRVIVQQVKAYIGLHSCRPTEQKKKSVWGLAGCMMNKHDLFWLRRPTSIINWWSDSFCLLLWFYTSPSPPLYVNTKEAKQTTWRCWLLGCSGNHINFATNPIIHIARRENVFFFFYFLCLTEKGKEIRYTQELFMS